MSYTKTTWVDDVTALTALNFNNMEQGIADAHPSFVGDYTSQGGSIDMAVASTDGYAKLTLDGLFVLGGATRELLGRVNAATLLDNRTTYSTHGNSGSGFF